MRLKRSRLIAVLIAFSVLFWLVLYWNVLAVYSNYKKQKQSLKAEGLPNDQFPNLQDNSIFDDSSDLGESFPPKTILNTCTYT